MSLIFNGTTVENVVYNGTALCKLVYNGTLVWENHAYGSWTTTTAATCTATGSKKRTCTRTGCGVSDTQTIAALGHKYLVTIIDPTCTEQGYTLHECTRDGCSYSYKDSYFDIDSTNHSYGSPTYTWSGNTSCTATRTCKNNSSHTETATATITSKVTTAATCTTEGVKTYTATFSESWATAQTKTVTIPATGHSYGLPMYVWNGYTSCTATRNCSKDSSHKETATATITSKVTKAATCTATGTRTYTATFSKSWASNQTKTETIAATGHKSSDWIIDSEATTLGAGSKHKECTVCGTVLETATIPKLEPLTYTLLSGGTYSVKATDVHVSGAITIPSTYNGKAVTRIEDNAFKGCTNIQSVAMPNSITYIGNRAFNTCTLMNTITMSNSVTYIGSRAFAGCHSLTTGVTIPASVTTIGAYAFEGCDKLLRVTFEHTKWNAGSTSVTVTAFNGATLLKTTYVSVAWTKVSTPTLVAPVFTNVSVDPEEVALSIKNNNSVAVTCWVTIYDDNDTEINAGTLKISANTAGTTSMVITSSAVLPLTIDAYFEADGYLDSDYAYAYT